MKNKKRLVYAEEVEGLINGLDSLPWEEDVRTLVNSLSTADAMEVVHGRINEVEIVPNYMWKYRCSCCYSDVERWYKYCPNCGAKME